MRVQLVSQALTLPLITCLSLAACIPLHQEGAQPPRLTVAPDERLLRVNAPALGANGLMKLVGRNGAVETWMSIDRYSVSLQSGIVVATRGFGFDMMAGDAEATLEALALGNAAEYGRQMRYLTSDNHSTWLLAACEMVQSGREGGLRRYDEICRARRNKFTNHYWVSDSGQILRSRQWVSPELGYLDIGFKG